MRIEFDAVVTSLDGEVILGGDAQTGVFYDGTSVLLTYPGSIGPGIAYDLAGVAFEFAGGGTLVPPYAGETQVPPDP